MPPTPGKPVGLTKLPLDLWGSGRFTGTIANLTPKHARSTLLKAESTGMALIGTIPRAQMTNTGQPRGYFVLSRAKAAVDGIAKALSASEWTRLRPYLRAVMLVDEPIAVNPRSWTKPASAQDIAEYARYWIAKIPGVPPIIRISPSSEWVRDYHNWPKGVIGYAQWHKKRGPRKITNLLQKQRAYYAQQYADAQDIGWGLIAGVNVRDIEGANSNVYASAAEIRTHVGECTRTPWNCFSTHWWYEPAMLKNSQIAAAWKDMVALGRSLTNIPCGGA